MAYQSGRHTWNKTLLLADGTVVDVTPTPGRTYTRDTWPPRRQGRGESLTSPRRITAKLRTVEVLRMRRARHTWVQIAATLGYADASGPYRAYWRAIDRINWDAARKKELTS